MIELTDIFIRKENIVLREIAGEILLVPIAGEIADLERLFCLNEVGGYIWTMLKEKANVSDIAAAVINQFEVDHDTAVNDLKELIAQLLDAGLVISKR